jgi:uncharacterized membrane protein
MLGAFVFNSTWFTILLVLHVMGAIIGLGPTFGFAIIGPAIGKQEHPAASLALLKVMHAIEQKMVLPLLAVVQLVSGIGLIYNRHLDAGFFHSDRAWLLAGIGLYIVALGLAMGVDVPAMGKLIHKAEAGQIDDEFGRLQKRVQKLGPVLTVLALGIMILMIWKPGGHCGPLVRC